MNGPPVDLAEAESEVVSEYAKCLDNAIQWLLHGHNREASIHHQNR